MGKENEAKIETVYRVDLYGCDKMAISSIRRLPTAILSSSNCDFIGRRGLHKIVSRISCGTRLLSVTALHIPLPLQGRHVWHCVCLRWTPSLHSYLQYSSVQYSTVQYAVWEQTRNLSIVKFRTVICLKKMQNENFSSSSVFFPNKWYLSHLYYCNQFLNLAFTVCNL